MEIMYFYEQKTGFADDCCIPQSMGNTTEERESKRE
jgi:hypothetical protein